MMKACQKDMLAQASTMHAPHVPQDGIVPRLEGDVKELTELGQLCACPHQALGEIPAQEHIASHVKAES